MTACVGQSYDTYHFPATGAPTRRTMPDRLSETVNVRDWGAVGDNSTNDAPVIQAAINFVLGRTPNPGGKIFFPPGLYRCNTALTVGSSNQNAGVQLLGSSFNGTQILGSVTGFLISKAAATYDNIERIEGLTISNQSFTPGDGAVKIVSNGGASNCASIVGCALGGTVGLDASGANGVSVRDCPLLGGGESVTTVDGANPYALFGIGAYLGNNCIAINCRQNGGNFITYALSGTGAAVISCSTEVCTIGCRVGWGPSGETAAVACRVENLQTERCDTSLDIYNATACLIQGNFLTGGQGTPNAQAIQNMSWNAGSHLVTVTTATNHNLPTGTSPLQLADFGGFAGTAAPWIAGLGRYIFSTRTGATTFTYPGPTSNPGAYTVNSVGWTYALSYTMRIRIASQCAFLGNDMHQNSAQCAIDLDYARLGPPNNPTTFTAQANHSNNVLSATDLTLGGIIMPSNPANLAGWQFSMTGSLAVLDNTVNQNPNPYGKMNFADLPGGASGSHQPGPLEGQEYSIKDSPTAASGNFGAVVNVGAGGNHVKVRYDGTNWRISG